MSKRTRTTARSFTLVELLLVVFILAAVAASAASLTAQADEQFRYDDTKARREEIRRAILGDPSRTANGQPVVSGFVADLGRIPASLRELVDPDSPPQWEFHPTPQQWAGWRGGYLRGDQIPDPTDADGLRIVYRDGWKNLPHPDDFGGSPALADVQDRLNFGWLLNVPGALEDGALQLRSTGSNGRTGGIGPFDSDWPLDPTLITSADHQLSLRHWRVTVTLRNDSATEITQRQVRLRLYAPRLSDDGSSLQWPDDRWLSNAVDLTGVATGTAWTSEFVFPDAPESDRVPCGVRTLNLVETDGSELAGLPRQPEAMPVTLLARMALQPLSITLRIPPP